MDITRDNADDWIYHGTLPFEVKGVEVDIVTPYNAAVYETEEAYLDLSGTADSPNGLRSVKWATSQETLGEPSGGTVTGMENWSHSGILLRDTESNQGRNVITVTATDNQDYNNRDTLTVIFNNSPPEIELANETITDTQYSVAFNVTDKNGNLERATVKVKNLVTQAVQ